MAKRKIAFILYQFGVLSGRSNGVRSQALSTHNILNELGDECILINVWEHYDWKSFDAIHIYGYDTAIHTFIKALSSKNPNIFISPIIDSTKPYFLYKWATFNGFEKLRLYSNNYALRKALQLVKGVCARSEHEAKFYKESFGINSEKIFTIPLSYSVEAPENINEVLERKENFCFHLSSLYQERKNVIRLVEAAKKYGFELVLAGNKGTDNEFLKIQQAIGDATNIKVLGFLSNEELKEIYSKAKVFALPSLNEGVGIVAMDAAVYGCNIAITNLKGPVEYYPNIKTVEILNPYSIDDIGKKIVKLLKQNNDENVYKHMFFNFSTNNIYSRLKNMYDGQKIDQL
ncbi:glycosyltransferase involved in cell wall biosynthesis [Flavobacterium chryseum]|uniref:glycosyltransferase family 4 protein n=1 Tax=Flavobacterium sp. P3160 TaxID=2512113 RepID=UPI001060F848|nr:glycosyltransferase family 4 protein [Flavobacterium sp. P3160]TDO71519.1 glycosyltransferase involved in cell wall biosynthesis [Flavobacterium sp. P3160]